MYSELLGFDFGILKVRIVNKLRNNKVIFNGKDLRVIEWLGLKQSNGSH
jgi:hypothetical protein